MIGRKVIDTNKYIERDELASFFKVNWNTETHNNFMVGKLGLDKNNYIILPVNEHFIVAVYPIKKNLFHKSDGVVLMSYNITNNMDEAFKHALLANVSPLSTIERNKKELELRNEQKTVVEEILIMYTEYLYGLLYDGYLIKEDGKVKIK